MTSRIRGHIRTNVVAYVALFFAFTAPASALVVTGAMVQDDSLTGADVLESSLDLQLGIDYISVPSSSGSASPKTAVAECPAGKRVVGTGYQINGGESGAEPDQLADVALAELFPGPSPGGGGVATAVFVRAIEQQPTSADWYVVATAVCARAAG